MGDMIAAKSRFEAEPDLSNTAKPCGRKLARKGADQSKLMSIASPHLRASSHTRVTCAIFQNCSDCLSCCAAGVSTGLTIA